MPQREVTEIQLSGARRLLYDVKGFKSVELALLQAGMPDWFQALQGKSMTALSIFLCGGLLPPPDRHKAYLQTDATGWARDLRQTDEWLNGEMNRGRNFIEIWTDVVTALQGSNIMPRPPAEEAASGNGGPPGSPDPASGTVEASTSGSASPSGGVVPS